MDFSSFFNDLGISFEFLFSRFSDFVSLLLSRPITYYVVFTIVGIPTLYFLIEWIQDFVSDGMGNKNFGRNNPLPPDIYQGYKGINRLIVARRKELSMQRGRIYKTKTLEYKGKRYRYVTSQRAPRDFNGNFNTDD